MAPTIHLRTGASKRLREILKCGTDGELAQALGMDVSHLSRLYNRRSSPGPSFIARVLTATNGKVTFEDIFEVIGDETPLRRAS